MKKNVFKKDKLRVGMLQFVEKWTNEIKAVGTLSKIMISQNDSETQVLIGLSKIYLRFETILFMN